MARDYKQGRYMPKNIKKYKGDFQSIYYRSSWELKFMEYCDKNDSILEWSSEETVIPYFSKVDNKVHRYFVDFWIKYKNKDGQIKKALIEIKPYSQTIQPMPTRGKSKKTLITEALTYQVNQDKWNAAKKYCDNMKMDFIVITEKQLF